MSAQGVKHRLYACALFCAALSCCAVPTAHAQEEEQDEDQQDAPPTAADETTPAHLGARVAAGAGLSMRSLEIPSFEGPRNLSTGLTPAVHLSVLGHWGDERRQVGLLMVYQSSLRARTSDQIGDQTLTPSEVSIRSHRFEAGLRPTLALTDGSRPVELGLVAGYGVRAFGSVEVLRIPRFSLHGPLLRAQLLIPLSSSLTLSLAPEAQLIMGITRDLRELAGLVGNTLAWGGETTLQLTIAEPWTVELLFREAHVRATAIEGRLWQDVERYLLVGLSYQVE